MAQIDLRLQESLRRVSGLSKLWDDYKGAYPNVDELRLAQLDPSVGSIATTYDNNKLYMWDGSDWQEIVGVGGVTNLNSLSDVTTSSPTNKQYLMFNSSLGYWTNQSFSQTLDELSDVNTGGAVSGQFLKYNGIQWVASTSTTPTQLSDLSDVDTAGVSNGNVLIYNSSSGEWEPSAPSNPTVLSDLSDVSSTTPTTNQVLTWNGSEWLPVTPTIPATNLSDLSDVSFTSLANGNIMQWNGTDWVNITLTNALLSLDYKGSYATTTALSTAYPTASGNQWALVEGIIYIHDGSGGWMSTIYEIWNVTSTTETELETLSNFDSNNEYTGSSIPSEDLVAGKRHKHRTIDGIYYEVLEDDTWSRKDLRMPRETIGTVISAMDVDATASTSVSKVSMVVPFDCYVNEFIGSCQTAPVGSSAIFDIHYEATPAGGAGTTIFSTKPTIEASEYTTVTSATASVISTATFAKGGMLHFYLDQVGSTTSGRGYVAMLNVQRID